MGDNWGVTMSWKRFIYVLPLYDRCDLYKCIFVLYLLWRDPTKFTSWNRNAFPITGPFVWEIHPSPVNSPHMRSVMQSFYVSLILAWRNCYRFQTLWRLCDVNILLLNQHYVTSTDKFCFWSVPPKVSARLPFLYSIHVGNFIHCYSSFVVNPCTSFEIVGFW